MLVAAAGCSWTAPADPGAPAPALAVETRGVTARIVREEVLDGPLAELNGRYKLRITSIAIEPGGRVGRHNHLGPWIRLMTLAVGCMEYVLPISRRPTSSISAKRIGKI